MLPHSPLAFLKLTIGKPEPLPPPRVAGSRAGHIFSLSSYGMRSIRSPATSACPLPTPQELLAPRTDFNLS